MRKAIIILAAIALSACATSYQSKGLTGGFDETQLDKNVFRITFTGNGYTKSDRAEEMALLRSAQVALKHGFTHFSIVEGKTNTEYGSFTSPNISTTTGTVSTFGNTSYVNARTTGGAQTFIVRRPSATNTIVCFNGKPEATGFFYDAQFIFSSLGKKYGVVKD